MDPVGLRTQLEVLEPRYERAVFLGYSRENSSYLVGIVREGGPIWLWSRPLTGRGALLQANDMLNDGQSAARPVDFRNVLPNI